MHSGTKSYLRFVLHGLRQQQKRHLDRARTHTCIAPTKCQVPQPPCTRGQRAFSPLSGGRSAAVTVMEVDGLAAAAVDVAAVLVVAVVAAAAAVVAVGLPGRSFDVASARGLRT